MRAAVRALTSVAVLASSQAVVPAAVMQAYIKQFAQQEVAAQ